MDVVAAPDDVARAAAAVRAPGRLAGFERALGTGVEVVVATLVGVEIVVLFAGVISRYLFDAPLLWTDELSSTLFVWLAMLGAAVALRRGEHMRMTALTCRARPHLRPFLDSLSFAAVLAFLLLMARSALGYVVNESVITTPALGLSNAWRAAALPVGFALMLAFALVRLIGSPRRETLAALGLVVLLCAAFVLLAPVFPPLGRLNLLVFFVGVLAVLVFSGIPIAFAFGLATFAYLVLTTHAPPVVILGRIDEGMSQIILLAVPLFVFLGLLIEATGMAAAMVNFLASLLGHVRGGLSYVLVGAMYLMSGISGSKAADMAAVAPVLFPELRRRGAKDGDLIALLSATGAQTETVPPSIVLITIGSVTGVSISALFTGGILPGVLLGFALCGLVWWRHRRGSEGTASRAAASTMLRAFVVALPALLLPFVIRAAVIEGVATATEVSTVGIVYAALAGLLIYRRFPWARLYPMLVSTAALSGAILLIIGMATGMAWALTASGFSASLAAFMAAVPGGGAGFLLVSALMFVVLGSVLEGIPAVVLFAPLLFPIARQVGVSPVQYAMVVTLAMGMGLFSPPFGVGYYAACAIGRADPALGMRPIVGYMVALGIGLALVIAVPWISTGFL